MFRLATVEDWFDITRSPELIFLRDPLQIGCVLKTIGEAYVVSMIRSKEPKRILEFGHAHTSLLFDLCGKQHELWGIDAARVDYVTEEELDNFRKKHEQAHGATFTDGYLGEDSSGLPDNKCRFRMARVKM